MSEKVSARKLCENCNCFPEPSDIEPRETKKTKNNSKLETGLDFAHIYSCKGAMHEFS